MHSTHRNDHRFKHPFAPLCTYLYKESRVTIHCKTSHPLKDIHWGDDDESGRTQEGSGQYSGVSLRQLPLSEQLHVLPEATEPAGGTANEEVDRKGGGWGRPTILSLMITW